jgi:hypothetical protein
MGEETSREAQLIIHVRVRIRFKMALFLVVSLTICFSEICLSNWDTGHLLKSPKIKITAFGYLIRARSSCVVRCSTITLLSLCGGW